MGSSAVDAIIQARDEGGLFTSLTNFCERVNLHKVSKRTIDTLVQVGAFDDLGHPRRRMCAALETIVSRAQKKQKDKASGQNDMFSMFSAAKAVAQGVDEVDSDEVLREFDDVGEWNIKTLLDHEKGLLGYYVSGHPLDRFKSLIKQTSHITISQLPECDRFEHVVLIGQVSSMRAIPSKRGGRIAFITFEDRTGTIEIVAGGQVLEIYEAQLNSGEPVVIMGEVKPPRHADDGLKVDIGRRGEDPLSIPMVQTLTELQSAKTRSLSVEVSERELPKPKLDRVRTLLENPDYAGRCPVIFHVHTSNGTQVFIQTRYQVYPDEMLTHELIQMLPSAKVHFLDRRSTEHLLYS
jgi:DNA polymerase-3 subunit alpha